MSASVRPEETYYPAFDYLRMVLALGVFISHARLIATEMVGNLCVQVFFALSGFLIGSILTHTKLENLPDFYFKRTTRIWIPYAIAILVLFAGCLAKGQPLSLRLGEFFFYKTTFVYNWFGVDLLASYRQESPLQGTGHHFWSICVEEQFYLVAPLIVILLGRLRVPTLVALLIVPPLLGEWIFSSIIVGVLFAISSRRFGPWYLARSSVLAISVVLLASLAAIATEILPYEFAAPAASVATVALLARPGNASSLGKFLGGVSYPFYLNHWIGLMLIRPITRLVGLEILGVLGGLVVSFAFSAGHYQLVDRQVLRHRKRWYTKRVGRTCLIAGVALVLVGFAGSALFATI